MDYLFTSERLGFRNWLESDIEKMAAINADEEVMRYFPAVKSVKETMDFIARMQQQFAEKGYCYYAVDRLDDGRFIGFIGLSVATFNSDFTPCTDIGWRLAPNEWNHGFATEGAKKCIEQGFQQLGLKKIIAIAPVINLKSAQVMQRAGMMKVKTFNHPLLANDPRLERCVLYEILPGKR